MCLESKRSLKADTEPLDNPPPAKHKTKGAASPPKDREFGTTLEEFGFEFDNKGVLRDDRGEGFVFNVRKNTFYNQRRYEALGNAVIEEVYNKLQEDCGLEKIYIPEGRDKLIDFFDNKLSNQNCNCFWLSGDTLYYLISGV